MNSRIVVGMFACLCSASSFAAVVDTFRCHAAFVDKQGIQQLVSDVDLAAVRRPVASDPNWIDGIVATNSHAGFTVADDSGLARITYMIDLTYYHDTNGASLSTIRAAQWSCSGITEFIDGEEPGPAMTCGATNSTGPYNPVFDYPPTTLSPSGIPNFTPGNVRLHDKVNFQYSPVWSSAQVDCAFLGTME